MFLVGLSSLALSSCDKDETPTKPAVTITEVGNHDGADGQIAAGDDLHLEAEIVAEGLIAEITVEIRQAENGAYRIEEKFAADSKYFGLKNVGFHEHIGIPAEAPLGEYRLHLAVRDKAGQTTAAETVLVIVAEDE
jgi:hypothetical protein